MEDREPQNGRVSVFSRPGSANGSINWTAETTTAVEALFRQTSLTNSDREDDFEALKAEALNRLKKKHRLHSAVLPAPSGSGVVVVDVKRLDRKATRDLVDRVFVEDDEGMALMTRVRDRLAAVGLQPPTVTVRYQDVTVQSKVGVGSNELPSIMDPIKDRLQPILNPLSAASGRPPSSIYRQHTILASVSGILKPGVFTVLLGPPRSSKTTFLRTLAGLNRRTPGLRTTAKELTYNGHEFSEFVVERSAAYITQDDVAHFSELTVRETLEFSARCQSTGHRRKLLEELAEREEQRGIHPDPDLDAYMRGMYYGGKHALIVEIIIRLLGLDVCADTVVGGAMMRGISGGQRKRVTTGEMIVGPARALFADEISTGLDSSTTHQIVESLRNVTHVLRATMLVSLLQPSPETFDLFDDVILLANGRVVFHGPREFVLPFFEGLGFGIPPRRGLADFLQEVTIPTDQEKFWDSERHGKPFRFITPASMQSEFQETEPWRRMMAELAQPYPRTEESRAALAWSKYGQPPFELLRALARRTWLLQKRTKIFAIIRTFQVGLMAFLTATVFWREDKNNVDDGQFFMGVLFYSLLYQLLGGVPESHVLCDRLPVMHKQRGMRFYPGWAVAIPTFGLRVPYCFLEATIWTMLVYWIVGFSPNVRFLFFWLIMFLINAWSLLLFQLIAAVCQDDTITTAVGSLFLLIFINISGYVINAGSVPPWWYEGLWPNPFYWAMKALAINEFTSGQWDKPNPADPTGPPLGIAILEFRGFPTEYWWCWAAVGFIIGTGILNLALFVLAMSVLGPGKKRVVMSEEALEEHALASRLGTMSMSDLPPVGLNRKRDLGAEETIPEEAEEGVDLENGTSPKAAPAGLAPLNVPRSSVSPTPAGPESSGSSAGTPQTASEVATPAESTKRSIPGRIGHHLAPGAIVGHVANMGRLPFPPFSPNGSMSPTRRMLSFEERHSFAQQAAEQYRKRTAIDFPTLVMTFRNVEYSVPLPKDADATPDSVPSSGSHAGQLRLLRGISGVFRPGVLTALMGASGAGKTTLMDVLAGRKTEGTITGDIRTNGHPKDEGTFARVSGYVEQTDVHLPHASVKEALEFSARLRLPTTVDNRTRAAFVDEILQLVELDRISGAFVGIPGVSGLSVEQRKRLTLAVELVANPSIVFMDEPTSGLDARAAAIVMSAIRNTVDSGRTVVCTIHQPSVDIFEQFDELLLLKPGGETTYFGALGDGADRLVDYLQAVPGVTPIAPRANPANWMLEEMSRTKEEALHVDFAKVYANSDLAREMDAVISKYENPTDEVKSMVFGEMHVASWPLQFGTNFQRFWRQYWRSPEYNLTRLLVTIAVAFVFGSLFWRKGDDSSTVTGVLNIAGVLFSSVVFMGITNCLTVQHVTSLQRAVMYRERAAGYYSVVPFALAQQAVEIPYLIGQTIIYSSIVYWMVYFAVDAGKFFLFILFFFLTLTYFTVFGMMAVALTPAVPLASILCSFFFGLWNLLCGFLIPKPSIPAYWRWFWYIDPVSWSLYSLAISQLGTLNDETIVNFQGETQIVTDFLSERFGWTHSMMWPIVPILLAFTLVFSSIAVFALAKINFQRR